MRFLKLIGLTLFNLAKQVCLFPKTVTDAIQQRRQQAARKELEVERLDRICDPSKYLGK